MKEGERDESYISCPTNALGTAVLRVVRSMNIHRMFQPS